MSTTKTIAKQVNKPTNGAKKVIELSEPYMVSVTFQGTSDMLFHAYNPESVKAKGEARKGSAAKKTDDLESYVWRDEKNHLSIPGEYFRMSCIGAAKFKQDPRSPRKSAMDLFKAGVVVLTSRCSLGKTKWDYEDKRGVKINMARVTRIRPAINSGWQCTCEFLLQLPEYIDLDLFIDTLSQAGKLCGVGDYRPSYGRFAIKNYEIID